MTQPSRDRVRFVLGSHQYDKGGSALREVCTKAFNYVFTDQQLRMGVTIVCRPSQFARFMIYRAEAIKKREIDGCNGFTDLKAELFCPDPDPCEIDVSKNRHNPT